MKFFNVDVLNPQDNFFQLPQKKHRTDTGYDLIATKNPNIVGEKDGEYYSSIDYIEYSTSFKCEIQDDSYCFLIFPRSSVSKYNLQLCNSVGVCDNSYRGEFKVRFNYLWQPKDFISTKNLISVDESKIYQKGDKIAQITLFPVQGCNFNLVDELSGTARQEGGFGSTGK